MLLPSKPLTKSVNLFTVFCFIVSIVSPNLAFAAGPAPTAISVYGLPTSGQMVPISNDYSFPVLKGLRLDPKNPLHIEFFIDTANDGKVSQEDANRLIRYFLAGLTIPEDQLWVNLSPYESDRITGQNISDTDLGKDLLSQDYILKQLTASVTHPDSSIGKDYWKELHQEMNQLSIASKGEISSYNKIWITPDTAKISECQDTAIVTQAKLKAMLEQDYLAISKASNTKSQTNNETSAIAAKVMKQTVLPSINQDINSGKNFATLRQIYYSLILAGWFKSKFKDSFWRYYINQANTKGIDLNDKAAKEKIYKLYCQAFSKGLYNVIRKENDPIKQKTVYRHYFSGGAEFTKVVADTEKKIDSPVDQEKIPSGPVKIADLYVGDQGGLKSLSDAMEEMRNDYQDDLVNFQGERIRKLLKDKGAGEVSKEFFDENIVNINNEKHYKIVPKPNDRYDISWTMGGQVKEKPESAGAASAQPMGLERKDSKREITYIPGISKAEIGYIAQKKSKGEFVYLKDIIRELNCPVEGMFFSVGVANSLRSNNILVLGELVEKTREELLALPGIGSTKIREIESELQKHGWRLGSINKNKLSQALTAANSRPDLSSSDGGRTRLTETFNAREGVLEIDVYNFFVLQLRYLSNRLMKRPMNLDEKATAFPFVKKGGNIKGIYKDMMADDRTNKLLAVWFADNSQEFQVFLDELKNKIEGYFRTEESREIAAMLVINRVYTYWQSSSKLVNPLATDSHDRVALDEAKKFLNDKDKLSLLVRKWKYNWKQKGETAVETDSGKTIVGSSSAAPAKEAVGAGQPTVQEINTMADETIASAAAAKSPDELNIIAKDLKDKIAKRAKVDEAGTRTFIAKLFRSIMEKTYAGYRYQKVPTHPYLIEAVGDVLAAYTRLGWGDDRGWFFTHPTLHSKVAYSTTILSSFDDNDEYLDAIADEFMASIKKYNYGEMAVAPADQSPLASLAIALSKLGVISPEDLFAQKWDAVKKLLEANGSGEISKEFFDNNFKQINRQLGIKIVRQIGEVEALDTYDLSWTQGGQVKGKLESADVARVSDYTIKVGGYTYYASADNQYIVLNGQKYLRNTIQAEDQIRTLFWNHLGNVMGSQIEVNSIPGSGMYGVRNYKAKANGEAYYFSANKDYIFVNNSSWAGVRKYARNTIQEEDQIRTIVYNRLGNVMGVDIDIESIPGFGEMEVVKTPAKAGSNSKHTKHIDQMTGGLTGGLADARWNSQRDLEENPPHIAPKSAQQNSPQVYNTWLKADQKYRIKEPGLTKVNNDPSIIQDRVVIDGFEGGKIKTGQEIESLNIEFSPSDVEEIFRVRDRDGYFSQEQMEKLGLQEDRRKGERREFGLVMNGSYRLIADRDKVGVIEYPSGAELLNKKQVDKSFDLTTYEQVAVFNAVDVVNEDLYLDNGLYFNDEQVRAKVTAYAAKFGIDAAEGYLEHFVWLGSRADVPDIDRRVKSDPRQNSPRVDRILADAQNMAEVVVKAAGGKGSETLVAADGNDEFTPDRPPTFVKPDAVDGGIDLMNIPIEVSSKLLPMELPNFKPEFFSTMQFNLVFGKLTTLAIALAR